MDIKDIRSLIKLVMETDITELELEADNEKIRIKRGTGPEVVYHSVQVPPPAASVVQQPVAVQAEQSSPVAVSAGQEAGRPVTSPIVGTLYRSPAPDAPPYVEVGQTVEKGQVLCIVEAMKLMNEIEAEYRCKILKVCKENAQPVEFGDTLFLVEPL
jgi:acetyl-CoA carboxylase biotin carboxyl carrier protein